MRPACWPLPVRASVPGVFDGKFATPGQNLALFEGALKEFGAWQVFLAPNDASCQPPCNDCGAEDGAWLPSVPDGAGLSRKAGDVLLGKGGFADEEGCPPAGADPEPVRVSPWLRRPSSSPLLDEGEGGNGRLRGLVLRLDDRDNKDMLPVKQHEYRGVHAVLVAPSDAGAGGGLLDG